MQADDLTQTKDVLTIVQPETFLSTAQDAEANICPAGGEHESAGTSGCGVSKVDYPVFGVHEYRDGKDLSVAIYACRKCSALYWKRCSGASQPSNRSSSTSSQP
jgi:hypothetical protein